MKSEPLNTLATAAFAWDAARAMYSYGRARGLPRRSALLGAIRTFGVYVRRRWLIEPGGSIVWDPADRDDATNTAAPK